MVGIGTVGPRAYETLLYRSWTSLEMTLRRARLRLNCELRSIPRRARRLAVLRPGLCGLEIVPIATLDLSQSVECATLRFSRNQIAICNPKSAIVSSTSEPR